MTAKAKNPTYPNAPKIDYAVYFTNPLAVYYISAFPGRLMKAGSEQEFDSVCLELDMALTTYSLLVYRLYPSNAEFRKKIQESEELRTNFETMKKWLDEQGGKQMTDEYMESLGKGAPS